jgi:UDP-N-acetylmuramoylalanine--D-glutamate ligase
MLGVLKELQNKKIAILGLGIENYALAHYLIANYRRIPPRRDEFNELDITICDKKNKRELGERYKKLAKKVSWKLGKNYDKNLYEFDILFRSPGWPIDCREIREAMKKSPHTPFIKGGVIVSSPMKLFFELCPTKNIIGVTGTKGKGTTASLIYVILKQSFKSATTNGAHANKLKRNVWLGGNIGTAPFEFLNKIYPAPFGNCASGTDSSVVKRRGVKKNDWVVLELSSFQLEDMEASPHIAVITNFYSEHLAPADPNNPNFHKTLKDYWEAKINIIKWQRKGDYAIINKKTIKQENNKTRNLFQNLNSKIIYFGKSDLPSKLIGEHNKENVAAAVEAAKIIGIKNEIIKKAVAGFKGLEHRLEFVKKIKIKSPFNKGGVGGFISFYNDSFATTPESAIIALKSFQGPVILLAGGAEKNSDFQPLAREIRRRVYLIKSSKAGSPPQAWQFNRVKFVVLLDGKATGRIRKELLKIKYPKDKIKLAKSMKEAVKMARTVAKAGDTVLLSPACASFGMFENYQERGRLFKEEVWKLK